VIYEHLFVRVSYIVILSLSHIFLSIIHCDLWTSLCESLIGFKYYLIEFDDFSRYVWTFPIRLKSDATDVLCGFYRYVLNQFHIYIQSIQCDNDKKFDNQ
jgi:hypothetical protein